MSDTFTAYVTKYALSEALQHRAMKTETEQFAEKLQSAEVPYPSRDNHWFDFASGQEETVWLLRDLLRRACPTLNKAFADDLENEELQDLLAEIDRALEITW